ncbi:MAG: hypothetical protein KDH84_13185, partial [Calditrichaeota bacterium]|nr:hypothetical protein [Calditrichota bacterium]
MNNTVISGGGTFNARDAVLTVNGVTGLVIESGSTMETLSSSTQLTGTGPLTVNGTFKWNRGDIIGSAPFTVNGTLDINGISTRDLNGRTLTVNGLMKWSSDGVLRLLNNAQVLNQAGGTIDMQADGSIDFFAPGGGTVTNNGTFQKTGGAV